MSDAQYRDDGAPEGHYERMIALADGLDDGSIEELGSSSTPEAGDGNQPVDETPVEGDENSSSEDRPEWLPEKFKSPEDMAKAYSELEKKLGQPKVTEDTPKSNEKKPPKPEEIPEGAEQAKAAVESKGIDYTALQAEFMENGELSAETYQSLEAKGIAKPMVDAFIDGQRAVAEKYTDSIYQAVGGADAYKSMIEWASSGISASEIKAYNKAINSGDVDAAMFAVKGLASRHTAEVGRDPKRQVVPKDGGVTRNGGVYANMDEVSKDMSNPKYKAGDPAFHRMVRAKLERSKDLV